MASKYIRPDRELVTLLKEGCDRAYADIYKKYWGVLYQHARKMLRQDEVAKDVVQEVFLALWTKKDELNLKGELSSYLYGAIRYKIFDLIDKGKVRENYLQSLEKFILRGEYSTDNKLLEKELALQIEKEISLLPEKMQEIFVLSRKFDLSHQEIATKLNISDQTVKKQVYNALKILRPKLGHYLLLVFNIFMF